MPEVNMCRCAALGKVVLGQAPSAPGPTWTLALLPKGMTTGLSCGRVKKTVDLPHVAQERPMPQATTPTPTPSTARPLPPLLVALWRLLAAHRSATRQQRVFDRLRAVVLGWLLTAARARHTLSQSLLSLGLVDTDPSAFYRLARAGRVDVAALERCFFRQTLAAFPATAPYPV